MKSRLPVISDKDKVCIICEGSEEYDYLDRLRELCVWNERYEITLDNADGNGNIPARYQDRYQNGAFDVVLVFCDTDKKPYEQYADIKRKINDFHGLPKAADEVVFYGNPCTLQIIMNHWDDVTLNTAAKKMNAPLVEEHTGIRDYKGRSDQRQNMMQQISVDNYHQMCQRVRRMSSDDLHVGSSNFDKLGDYLGSADDSWIRKINNRLDGMLDGCGF